MGNQQAKVAKLLVICDQPVTLLGLQCLLEAPDQGIVVVGFVATPVEAIALAKTAAPTVVLLDIDGDNGIAVIPQLLVDCCARVLAWSVTHHLQTQDAAILSGACGILDKREPAEIVLKAVERVNAGELWLDRSATVRILTALARKRTGVGVSPEQEKIASLTRKERLTVSEVTRNVAASGREIAQRMNISEHTLRNHLSSIYGKLGLSGRMELYAYAQRHGLVGAPAT